MLRTKEEQEAWELQAMGCTAAALKETNFTWRLPDIGRLMMAMGILSDAQEMMVRGDSEVARQYVNRAKMFLMEEMDVRKARAEALASAATGCDCPSEACEKVKGRLHIAIADKNVAEMLLAQP